MYVPFQMRTDSYKITHHSQYEIGTQVIHSYMEPRVGAMYQDIIWCGLQHKLLDYGFCGLNVVTQKDIDISAKLLKEHFGFEYFNKEGWEYILKAHNGSLPIRIRALPEGTIVSPGTPVLSVENTDEKVPWLTNYIESMLMHAYASTDTASISYDVYRVIKKWADQCGDVVLPVHLNDFGYRGASSEASAIACGLAHLLVFIGTDNLPAIWAIREHYDFQGMAGVSVKASEHSTMTSWGENRECEAYKYIIETTPDEAIVSLVIDSYNWERAVSDYFCNKLVDLIKSRKGKVVLRPDSGVPWLVTRQILDALWNTYGGTKNEKGFKVLDPHVGIIYGDGINAASIDKILSLVVQAGYAPSNVIFGMGGGLLQQHNRDTLRFAIKCSAEKKNGVWTKVFKTTPGKESKGGRFDQLPLVYENGYLINRENFQDMRKRVGILI